MRQVLHLLIVHAGSRTALAAHYGSRWLLPVLACGERVRADPIAVRWAADRGVHCNVAGQWLGRIHPDGADWLMVLNADRVSCRSDPHLVWTPLHMLVSTAALFDYQRYAVARSMKPGPLPSVPGPFGRCAWMADVKAWIAAVSPGTPNGHVCQLRSSPHEVVLRAPTACGEGYFKGFTREWAGEAALTQAFASLEPERFAQTLAVEERPDGSTWWLSAACPGRPAVDGGHIARALAGVQQRAMQSMSVRRQLRTLDLDEALACAIRLLEEGEAARAIEAQVKAVSGAAVPRSWIPMDLHATNVLVDERGHARFIDLDDSFLGPAPLAMALFAMRSRATSSYRLYEESWTPPLADLDWTAFEVTAAVIDTWLGWGRVERNVRRGEVDGALEIAATRIRERLRRAVHLR